MSRIFPDLIAEGQRDRTLADVLRSGLQRRRREAGRRTLQRALARDELRRETDIELALDLMVAPLFWRVIDQPTSCLPCFALHRQVQVPICLQPHPELSDVSRDLLLH